MVLTLFVRRLIAAVCLLAGLFVAVPAGAQVVPAVTPEISSPVPPCSVAAAEKAPGDPEYAAPPAGSPPVVRCFEYRFHPVNASLLDTETTYDFYVSIDEKVSNMRTKKWVPYEDAVLLADFNTLWGTAFLDDLWMEVIDEPYDNGVIGKHVIYHLEERVRLKGVDYEGSKKVEVSKIEEMLKERNITLRFDNFVDQATIRRVQGVVRDLYAERGYLAAEVTPELTSIGGGPKLVRLVFHIKEGPIVKIRQVDFQGNRAFKDGTLIGKMKDTKPHNWLSWLMNTGTYQEAKYAEDAQKLTEFYQNHGYVRVRVGEPQVEVVEDTKDGKTRWVELKIFIDEGQKYRLGKLDVSGNKAIRSELLLKAFKMTEGELISRKKIVKGIGDIRKAYGTFGYWEFDASPDFCFRGTDCETGKPLKEGPLPDIVDVTMKIREGQQFLVNRITFLGNATTHDSVIRREMRVQEGGVFNSEALTDSVKRLNQLGYFKPLEKPEDMDVQPVPGQDGLVNIRLKFEEQNRNQIAFGAGVSQFDGFFGQLSFQTSNFLGRGETLGISLQRGGRARNYQVTFSEPYLFDRPITAGMDLYSREYIFISQYTERETGGGVLMAFPLGGYKRLTMGYSYSQIGIRDINPIYAGLLSELNYTVSRISPGFLYNTVNQPIFPTRGARFTAGMGIAGIGGNTQFVSGNLESIYYHQLSNRMSFGVRGQAQYAWPYSNTTVLPISERVFLGGEYSVRGFDLRSIGPRDPISGAVIGGNKAMVFNAEYYINILGPVRFLFFYDAGQVRSIGERFQWQIPTIEVVQPGAPVLTQPPLGGTLIDPNAPKPQIITTGHLSAFKTSTGAELRFFMPVLNVPFRLIAAWNPQRVGVLNNQLRPTQRFVFRFAVGTTF